MLEPGQLKAAAFEAEAVAVTTGLADVVVTEDEMLVEELDTAFEEINEEELDREVDKDELGSVTEDVETIKVVDEDESVERTGVDDPAETVEEFWLIDVDDALEVGLLTVVDVDPINETMLEMLIIELVGVAKAEAETLELIEAIEVVLFAIELAEPVLLKAEAVVLKLLDVDETGRFELLDMVDDGVVVLDRTRVDVALEVKLLVRELAKLLNKELAAVVVLMLVDAFTIEPLVKEPMELEAMDVELPRPELLRLTLEEVELGEPVEAEVAMLVALLLMLDELDTLCVDVGTWIEPEELEMLEDKLTAELTEVETVDDGKVERDVELFTALDSAEKVDVNVLKILETDEEDAARVEADGLEELELEEETKTELVEELVGIEDDELEETSEFEEAEEENDNVEV